jgi:uncharacterized protein YbcI
MSDTEAAHSGGAGSRSAAISNLTVRLVSQYTGRGPTKARTYFNDDMVSVVLQDSLTKAENLLIERGYEELVLATRLTFQKEMRDDLVTGLETIMERKVLAFLSANHISPDIAIETFILAPGEHRASQHGAARQDGRHEDGRGA